MKSLTYHLGAKRELIYKSRTSRSAENYGLSTDVERLGTAAPRKADEQNARSSSGARSFSSLRLSPLMLGHLEFFRFRSRAILPFRSIQRFRALSPGALTGTSKVAGETRKKIKLQPQILIFDVDGVLVDVRGTYWRLGLPKGGYFDGQRGA